MRCRFQGTVAALVLAALTFGTTSTGAAEMPRRLKLGQTFIAQGLDPAKGSAGSSLVSHGIAEQLFRVNRQGMIEGNLAAAAGRNEDGSWTVTLTAGRRFSDGSAVDAAAVAQSLNRTGEMNPAARASAGRLTFVAVDDRTLRVTTEHATAILPSILAEWAFPIYRETPAGFVFTGPYAVAAFEPGAKIDLTPNSYFADAQRRPAITLRRIADSQSLALALRAGELDLAFNLPVEALPAIRAEPDLTVKSFAVGYQYMAWLNTRRPPLTDPRVRKAIDLAIDRRDLVKVARGGQPATGAFATSFPFAAPGPLPFDREEANRLLDAAGYARGPDGRRGKNGQPLTLTLVAYPQRPDLVAFQPVIRAHLDTLGISLTTQVTDAPNEAVASGAFDIFLWAQHTAPAGDPTFFLSLFFESGAARNYSGWSNPAYDQLLATLRQTADAEARIRLARTAQDMIRAEAPVVFLTTPEWHVGLSKQLSSYEPWGSDYYIVRPETGLSR